MMKTRKSRAEEQFAALQRQTKPALTEHEFAQQERAEHIAKLRALRLAKEASERESVKIATTAKSATGGAK